MPNVGQTLVLIENEGRPQKESRYIRATAVSVVERSFTKANTERDYKAAVVTVAISDALRFDFTGSPASRTLFTRATNSTKTRDTVVGRRGTYCRHRAAGAGCQCGRFHHQGRVHLTQLVPMPRPRR